MRLAIGGPTRDSVPASFAVDVAQLYAYTQARGPWSTVTIGFVASTYIHVGREWFLEASIKQGATHVLWTDTDMTLPRETAILLAGHDVPIVGCNYRTRTGGALFTAQREDGLRIATDAESDRARAGRRDGVRCGADAHGHSARPPPAVVPAWPERAGRRHRRGHHVLPGAPGRGP